MKKVLAIVLSMVLILGLTLPAAAISTIKLKSIKLENSRISMRTGETDQLRVTFSPVNTSQKLLKYSTSNKNVVSVDREGNIVAVSAGKAVITITSYTDKKVTAKCNVTISKVDDTSMVKLKWYVIGNGQPKDAQKVQDEVNKYIKDKLNASVSITCFLWGDDYEKKMTAKVASGEQFDICFTSSWALNYGVNAAKGAYVDLTNLLGKYAPKTKALLGDAVLKGSQINGRNYAIPANKEMAHNWGFVVRQDLADKYNFDLTSIKKFTDIEPMLKVIKASEPGVYPLEAVTGESPYRSLDFEKMVDDDVPGALYGDARDTKVVNDFETPEALALFTMMHKYYQAGYIRKDADTVTDYSADTKAGKIFAAIRSLKPGKDKELSSAEGQNWTQISLTRPMQTTREMTGSMQAISKSSKNPQRALRLLELFNTDPYLNNLINFGIEGTHYVKVSDKIIDFAPATNNGKDSKYNPGTPWMFGNQFINYLFTNEDPKKWDNFKAFNASAGQSKVLGFTFDVQPVKTQIAALKSAKKQFVPGLETGKSDPSVVLPQLNAKLKASGLDTVLKEMQRQIDAFLKAKK